MKKMEKDESGAYKIQDYAGYQKWLRSQQQKPYMIARRIKKRLGLQNNPSVDSEVVKLELIYLQTRREMYG